MAAPLHRLDIPEGFTLQQHMAFCTHKQLIEEKTPFTLQIRTSKEGKPYVALMTGDESFTWLYWPHEAGTWTKQRKWQIARAIDKHRREIARAELLCPT